MFITLEGMEGSGKSTVLKKLHAWLESEGYEVVLTREPGGSELGKTLRALLLDAENTDITSEAELFLYLADRAQHVSQVIKPALEAGKVVLCDRYADSTVVYQGYGRGLDPNLLHSFNEVATTGLWPDISLLLDVEPEIGLRRALSRNIEQGLSRAEGRFEAEAIDFHSRVREGYLTWAALNNKRFKVVDASVTPDEVFAQVVDCMRTAIAMMKTESVD
ncbi:dTMP kinase [Halodesulfovibrio marinisediminis]|uniref:Thymidylate kinase n=1 Tax=Halodesulfovibrio marinisediminis DSM 17456 TaxID=1121457 RepID=A0A1N6DI56_9BACT|nr:dTMP kinase [Halodesulfovibrio marinisediminis]SIN70416.1 thymidylate kinase [Halodesulfovibrio marinisediminis DSM 17456]